MKQKPINITINTDASRAGFGAMNCQVKRMMNRSTKLEHSTTPCLAANVCYGLPFFSRYSSGRAL